MIGYVGMVVFLKKEVIGALDQLTYSLDAGFVHKGLDASGPKLIGQRSVQQQINALFYFFRVKFTFGDGWIELNFLVYGEAIRIKDNWLFRRIRQT